MLIFNSKTRKKEEFIPIHDGKVGIYACGPTVYDYFHVGNARAFVTFDILRRYFEYKGYDVTFVQNFTDIDDKMIKRANEEGITVSQLADRFIEAYMEDAKALGVSPADIHPRATEHIPQIIHLIEALIEKGKAYVVNGNVYYKVRSFPNYGSLSGQNIEDLEEGASKRTQSADEMDKMDPIDFALWKAQKEGEPSWESPWGNGRPGWHIECSAMSMEHLGNTVDIHCGGCDLIFPHHENEIAQSEGATGEPYVRYWMHNGFINIDNQKMSKSKNNFFTIRDIKEKFDLEVVRMFLLSAHYRNPINFSADLLEQAQASLTRLYNAKDQLYFLLENAQDLPVSQDEEAFIQEMLEIKGQFEQAMDDDLNTADAIGVLFELVRKINSSLNQQSSLAVVNKAIEIFTTLTGLLNIVSKNRNTIPDHIQKMAEERTQARGNKDWQKSDELRELIQAAGYSVEDTAQGQKIRKQL
ncbi:MAG: cysteine--tRNA ligase [Clostridiales bacterium]|nr:cysteine--tRNA ligase [Clostridiales bacterium]